MKCKYFGHLIRRKNSLEKSLMLGTIDDKRRRGRQRMKWLDGVTEAVGMLGPPLNLTLDDVNDNSVTLTWDAPENVGPSGPDGYVVEHCKDGSEAVAVLNRYLAEVMGWMRANKLSLNPDKTEVLLVGGAGLQLRPYLDEHSLATVIHALVTSHLDYCNTLYVELPSKMVLMLQLVQNRAARLLTGTGHYSCITQVLYQLRQLPVEVRAQFKVLVLTYKALNGLGPGYLKERLFPYMPSHPLRSVGEALLQEPSLKEIKRTTTRSRPSLRWHPATDWVAANNKPFLSTRYVIRNLTSGDKLHFRVRTVKGDEMSDPAVLDQAVLIREILGMYRVFSITE
ncbi:Myosin-binding protein H, partial [Varanus komodoensis]